MEHQGDFFSFVIRQMNQLKFPYMIVGSIASTIYGDARLTQDMDVVLAIETAQADALMGVFQHPDIYMPPRDVLMNALTRYRQFNIIHAASQSKVDFVVLKKDPYDIEAFSRRKELKFAENLNAYFASPEDVIISKLRFYREGESEKHLRDIAGMLKNRQLRLDFQYLKEWIARLDLLAGWQKAQSLEIE